MKRILLTILLLSLLPFGVNAGPAKSKIAVISLTCGADGLVADDAMKCKLAQTYQICANRGWDVYYVEWNGDSTALKTALVDSAAAWGIEFAAFLGGQGRNPETLIEPEDGSFNPFIDPNPNYCSVPSVWWIGYDARDNSATFTLGTDATNKANMASNDGVFFHTANYSGALDTVCFYTNPDMSGAIAKYDGSTAIDSILTYASYETVEGSHYLALWSRTSGGVVKYYMGMQDGGAGVVLDALICKHVTYYDPLYFTFDLDDFGMAQQIGGDSHTITTFPNDTNAPITTANFWSNLDSLFQAFEDYGFKLNVGTVAKNVRERADTNQWAEWYGLAQRWKDSPNLAWVWHDHGLESDTDTTSALFAGDYHYRAFNITEGSSALDVQLIDSLYDDSCDSIRAWGLTVSPYIIPPWDNVDGAYDDIGDSIATMCGQNGLAMRSLSQTVNPGPTGGARPYLCSQDHLGCKVLLGSYLTAAGHADTSLVADSALAVILYQGFWGPNFFYARDRPGMSPGATDVDSWGSAARRFFDEPAGGSSSYERFNSRVSVMHTGACYNANKNLQLIRKIGQTMIWLEWLAGKDIYQSKFAHELANDPKCWRQVRR